MATKLKNLKVTKVDFVDQGANPDAYIQLFKRKDGPEDEVQKGAKLFAETKNSSEMEEEMRKIRMFLYALGDSLESIMSDNDLTADGRRAMVKQSLKEFGDAMDKAMGELPEGTAGVPPEGTAIGKTAKPTPESGAVAERAKSGLQKSATWQEAMTVRLAKEALKTSETKNIKKEETDIMKIDKSRMTPEELAVLEEIEKKYGTADEPAGGDPVPGGVTKNNEGGEPTPDGVTKGAEPEGTPGAGTDGGTGTLHPDVQKALSDMRAAYAAQTKQMEALQKSLDIERLTQIARKYEPLGKKADELAEKMYDLKKAGGTVYSDYVALLDENLALLGKSRLFGEIGSSHQGSAGTEESIGIKAAELTKSANGGMTHAEAVVKAFEENPELAVQYEQEYMRR